MDQITGDMKVAEVIQRWPRTIEVFLAHGCPDMRGGFFGLMAKLTSVRNAARMHKLDLEPLLDALNGAAQVATDASIGHAGQSMDVKYFKDIDTDAVYACIGPMAAEALFRLRDPQASNAQWEFLVPNSPAWDAVHQGIYRNPRVEEVKPDEFPAPLPCLPEILRLHSR